MQTSIDTAELARLRQIERAASKRFGTIAAIDSLIHLPKELFDKAWDPIWYPADFLAMSGSAVAVAVQIASNRDFVCMGGVITVTANGAPGTFVQPAAYTAQIQIAGNQQLMGQVGTNTGFVHINNLFGQVGTQNAGRWPVAALLARNTQLTTILNNLDATTRDVRVAYYGFSVY